MTKIRINQVWKSKDKRDGERFIKVNALAVESAWCVPCFASGIPAPHNGQRSRYIRFNSIRSRYELVKESNGATRE